jgi:protein gp37
MAETTAISWTDSTLNPWIGCQRVSPGCELCYAEVQDARGRWDEGRKHWGPTATRYRTSRSTWNNALRWNAAAAKLGKRHLVFCASLADVFEDRAELSPWRSDLFALIRATPALTWQILTKRPENIARLWPASIPSTFTIGDGPSIVRDGCPPPGAKAWPNVWLGTTCEDQQRADERLPYLLGVPAALHWVSAEPLLGPLDLRPWLWPDAHSNAVRWVIVGGESDVGALKPARPFDLQWADQILRQCVDDGVAFFMKQLGSNALVSAPESAIGPWSTDSRKGDEIEDWPDNLRVQQFPAVGADGRAVLP